MNDQCRTYRTYADYRGTVLVECDQCHKRYYFRSAYFAKQWANIHVYDPPRAVRFMKKYAIA